jgi:hypothetical protein
MFRRVIVLLMSAILMSVLGGTMALPAFADLDETDPGREAPGQPADANCWGEVTSDVASPLLGKHAASQEEPRQGVGNVAMQPPTEGGDRNPGEHVSDHGAAVGPGFGAECDPDRP